MLDTPSDNAKFGRQAGAANGCLNFYVAVQQKYLAMQNQIT